MSHKTLLVNTKPHGRVHISQDDCPWLTKDKLPPHYKTMLARDVPADKATLLVLRQARTRLARADGRLGH
jgi:hypothetical protein